jgi:PST family polysaccharide transporter
VTLSFAALTPDEKPPDAGTGGRETRQGVAWSTATYVATRVLTFGSTAVLARLLTPNEFGVVAAILVFVAIVELTSDVGMKASVVYEQERGLTSRLDVAFTLNVLLAAVLSAVGVLVAPAVADFFGLGDRVDLFRVAALNPLLVALGNVHDATLLRALAFRRRMVPEVVRTVVRAATQIALAVAGVGAAALIVGVLIGSLSWSAALWVLTRYRPRLRLERATARELLRYGLPASALELLAVVGGRLDIVVIGRELGDRVLGLYALAFRIPELLIESVSWAVSRVAFPALARERVRNESGLGAMTAEILRWQALYVGPVAATLAVLSPAVIVVLFGPPWREAAGVLSGIAVAAAIGSLTYPVGDALKATARQRTLVLLNVGFLPVFAATIIIVAPAGIVAVAWARVGTRVLFGCGIVVAASRTIGLRPWPLAVAAGPGLAAALGAGAGAGAVRLAWPAAAVGPLLAGGLAAAAGAALALRVIAPATFRDALAVLPGRRRQAASGV